MILGHDMNTLYYGDNLDVLRRYIKSDSVDLVYLDPPFQSGRDYSVLFAEQDGTKSAAQIQAFEDTWEWDEGSAATFDEVVRNSGKVANALLAFRQILGDNALLAYLSMMAPRLVELQRVLKSTGCLYLHCDPTASHPLKMLLDAIFGAERFVSEIIWKRTHSHGDPQRKYGAITDTLFLYSKSDEYVFTPQYRPFSLDYVKDTFTGLDPDGRRWQSVTLRSPNPRINLTYPYTASNGITYLPHPNGWSCDPTRMETYDREGRLHFPSNPTGALRLKMYLDKSLGVKIQNLWDDISPISANAQERLGYPTQKPVALLERIIAASSSKGDVVLDPFCGCGTTIEAAQRLQRGWIGIDITHLAVGLIKSRLLGAFASKSGVNYEVIGEPTDLAGARQLAQDDRHQFEHWALGLVGARASAHGKGADKGIDGVLMFQEGGVGSDHKRALISVKSGHVHANVVSELRGVVEREKAALGVLIVLEEPTVPMRREAASAGFYDSPWGKHPRLQILTIEGLLGGGGIDMPPIRPGGTTFKQAVRVETPAETLALPGVDVPPSAGKKKKRRK